MTRKKQDIQAVERQIVRLQVKLAKLKSLPDIDFDEKLFGFEDFPKTHLEIVNAMYLIMHSHLDGPTVGDLVHSSMETLTINCRMTPSNLKLLTKWMDKHNLQFVGPIEER